MVTTIFNIKDLKVMNSYYFPQGGHTHTHIGTCTHKHTYIIHKNVHTHVHTRTHTHTHTSACMRTDITDIQNDSTSLQLSHSQSP